MGGSSTVIRDMSSRPSSLLRSTVVSFPLPCLSASSRAEVLEDDEDDEIEYRSLAELVSDEPELRLSAGDRPSGTCSAAGRFDEPCAALKSSNVRSWRTGWCLNDHLRPCANPPHLIPLREHCWHAGRVSSHFNCANDERTVSLNSRVRGPPGGRRGCMWEDFRRTCLALQVTHPDLDRGLRPVLVLAEDLGFFGGTIELCSVGWESVEKWMVAVSCLCFEERA
ncbi:hypothetical protein CH063_15021 [Colletotrichum higginsianum]|uniref:Uncharacterized protein n=1 Tax=Colletotrichum higginsianum (strain IMI 349063) TaxID=759273 RepID=H1W112_COLHI|nr:hypothetical protein CH063_15021 [Colletotrichum higginsianum]